MESLEIKLESPEKLPESNLETERSNKLGDLEKQMLRTLQSESVQAVEINDVSQEEFQSLLQMFENSSFSGLEVWPRLSYNGLLSRLYVECMPTPLHEVCTHWFTTPITRDRRLADDVVYRRIQISGNVDVLGFVAEYNSTTKAPDVMLMVDSKQFPNVVIETGWSESYEKLKLDARVWLIGGNSDDPEMGKVHLVIILNLKWVDEKISDELTCSLERWERADTQNGIEMTWQMCFSSEADDLDDEYLEITFGDLFGEDFCAENVLNVEDIMKFSISNLQHAIVKGVETFVSQKPLKAIWKNKKEKQQLEERQAALKATQKESDTVESRHVRASKRKYGKE